MKFTGLLRQASSESTSNTSSYEEPADQKRARAIVNGTGRVGGENIELVEAEMKRRRQSGHYASAAIGNLPTLSGSRGDEAAPEATRTGSDASIFERLANERLERGRALMRADSTPTDGPTESLSTRLQRENDDRARSAWLGSSDDADES